LPGREIVNILLIRLRLIGDVVFTTPVIRALRRAFPHARLSYLVERPAAPVVAGNPYLDDVIVVGRPRGLARLIEDARVSLALRRRRFDVAIDLHGGPRSATLTLATGAPQRIGYEIKGRSWMYTHTVARPRELRARHSVVNQWDLLEAIDGWPGETPDASVDPVEMPLDARVAAHVSDRLRRAGVMPAHELIVVHVSAGNPFRRWPESAFVQVCIQLAASSADRRIVLSSGPSDRHSASRIGAAARAGLPPEVRARIVEAGEFDLAELRALLAHARLFIGGDTGPLHIAATTSSPIVGLYGPTLPARSAPWRDPGLPTESVEVEGLDCRPCDQRVCVHGDFRCLTSLPPDAVLNAANRVLRLSA
jgi:lipopolysaccharide heptosyltransferase II